VNATAAKVLYFISEERRGGGGLGFWVCFEANGLRFLWGGCVTVKLGAQRRRYRGVTWLVLGAEGWDRRYVVATME
jgi:hypothetical protein